MANREWILTKVVGTALGLVTLISICLGGGIFVVEVKQDILRVEDRQVIHESKDEKEWEKAWSSIDANKDSIHALELSSTRIETKLDEIMRRLEMIDNRLAQFEVVE